MKERKGNTEADTKELLSRKTKSRDIVAFENRSRILGVVYYRVPGILVSHLDNPQSFELEGETREPWQQRGNNDRARVRVYGLTKHGVLHDIVDVLAEN